HAKTQPYCCTHCGKHFTQSSTLYRHIRVSHDNQRSYDCNRCEKSFQLASHLTRHEERVHHVASTRKSQACSECEKMFFDAYDLLFNFYILADFLFQSTLVIRALVTSEPWIRILHLLIHSRKPNIHCVQVKPIHDSF